MRPSTSFIAARWAKLSFDAKLRGLRMLDIICENCALVGDSINVRLLLEGFISSPLNFMTVNLQIFLHRPYIEPFFHQRHYGLAGSLCRRNRGKVRPVLY